MHYYPNLDGRQYASAGALVRIAYKFRIGLGTRSAPLGLCASELGVFHNTLRTTYIQTCLNLLWEAL
jgi:hypothetical protein